VKWGFKSFTLADANMGYMLNILVFTGAQMLDDANPQVRSLPVLTRSVLHLVSPYLGKGHHVVADCFYSSLPLVDTLAEHNTTYTGTINKNRVGLPKAIRAPFSLRDGGSIRFRSERLMVIAWRAKLEKVPVIITSSSLPATMTQVSNRRGENMTKPLAIDTYNHTMNGVDRKDHTANTTPLLGGL